jgi:hypothetical protein
MSFINPPSRPVGDDEEAQWVKWVHDEIAIYGKLINAPGITFSHTTKGIIPKISAVSSGDRTTFHPFKVYQSPAHDAAEDWRTFRVRAGAYGTTPVLGTDGADVAAGGNVAEGVNDVDDTATEVEDTAYNADFDIIVPDATLAYYIWIDAATDPAEPVIDHGATIPGGGTDDDWWNGSGYILIAIIDTATLTSTKVAKRRQFVRDDVPKCLTP